MSKNSAEQATNAAGASALQELLLASGHGPSPTSGTGVQFFVFYGTWALARVFHGTETSKHQPGLASWLEFNLLCETDALLAICTREYQKLAIADCWRAEENLALAAQALGLATCVMGAAIPAMNTTSTKHMLKIPSASHIVAPIVVGRPRIGRG
jgi:hypothetical protein